MMSDDKSLKRISFGFAEKIAAQLESMREYEEIFTREEQDMIERHIERAIKADRDRTQIKVGFRRVGLNSFAAECHTANEKWWRNPKTGKPIERNKGELLMLIVSELAEAMEGERKNLTDDKLPHRKMAEVELVDALIRIFDYAGAFGFDLDGAYADKMAYNAAREDHTHEARLKEGGKQW